MCLAFYLSDSIQCSSSVLISWSSHRLGDQAHISELDSRGKVAIPHRNTMHDEGQYIFASSGMGIYFLQWIKVNIIYNHSEVGVLIYFQTRKKWH